MGEMGVQPVEIVAHDVTFGMKPAETRSWKDLEFGVDEQDDHGEGAGATLAAGCVGFAVHWDEASIVAISDRWAPWFDR